MSTDTVAILREQAAAILAEAEAEKALAYRRASRKYRKGTEAYRDALDAADARYAAELRKVREHSPGQPEFRRLHPNFDLTGAL